MINLTLSYKMAINGAYQNTKQPPDPLGQYFHNKGATVRHSILNMPNLEFTDAHMTNIINLIYYVKRFGYNNFYLLLDEEASYNAIKNKFYSISSLPEVIAKVDEKNDCERILSISYEENYDSLIEAQLDGMSEDDFSKMIDDVFEGFETENYIPSEIMKKYKVYQSHE